MHSGSVYTLLPKKKAENCWSRMDQKLHDTRKEPQAAPLKCNSISAGVACANRYSMLAGGNGVPW